MSIFNPIWRVTIGGVQYQTAILANLTITSGRTNIYEQAQAGYTNLEIINLDQSNVSIAINQAITIELQDSTNTFVPIFGGSIVEVSKAKSFSQKPGCLLRRALLRWWGLSDILSVELE